MIPKYLKYLFIIFIATCFLNTPTLISQEEATTEVEEVEEEPEANIKFLKM